jgi:hypothetical protein
MPPSPFAPSRQLSDMLKHPPNPPSPSKPAPMQIPEKRAGQTQLSEYDRGRTSLFGRESVPRPKPKMQGRPSEVTFTNKPGVRISAMDESYCFWRDDPAQGQRREFFPNSSGTWQPMDRPAGARADDRPAGA